MKARRFKWINVNTVCTVLFAAGILLSTVSCGGRSRARFFGATSPNGYCDGTLGNFDVYVTTIGADQFGLYLVPVAITPGDRVSVILWDNSTGAYYPPVPEFQLAAHTYIEATLSGNQLMSYNTIRIKPSEPGLPFNQTNAPGVFTECPLPLPGGALSGR